MSNKKVPGVCIVVDASIAMSAGQLISTNPTGAVCRDFLIRLRGVGHGMAWNKAIKSEWDRHQSPFARTWLVSMVSTNKIRRVPDEPLDELREAIATHTDEGGVVAAMVKDAHLLEAALASDRRVSALDDTARDHFRRLAGTCELVRPVVWVNPAAEGEDALDWLQRGAPDEAVRRLGTS